MKLKYREGTTFLVPLNGRAYACGVVARLAPKGKILLGYFFRPRPNVYTISDLEELSPLECILCVRFGDLGIHNGTWPILGQLPHWDRSKWPMPDFVRRDDLNEVPPRLVQYSDDDPSHIVKESRLAFDNGALGDDAFWGAGAVEIKLTMLLK